MKLPSRYSTTTQHSKFRTAMGFPSIPDWAHCRAKSMAWTKSILVHPENLNIDTPVLAVGALRSSSPAPKKGSGEVDRTELTQKNLLAPR